MKKTLLQPPGCFLLLLLFLVAGGPLAGQTTRMVIRKTDGSTWTIPVRDIEKITFSGVTGIEDFQKLATAMKFFEILRAYPNPARGTTRIEYRLDEPGPVRIKILNRNGIVVREMVNRVQPAGFHFVEWPAGGSSDEAIRPGLYFCTIEFKKQVLSEKIIIIE
jgi:hypothetical protein